MYQAIFDKMHCSRPGEEPGWAFTFFCGSADLKQVFENSTSSMTSAGG